MVATKWRLVINDHVNLLDVDDSKQFQKQEHVMNVGITRFQDKIQEDVRDQVA